MCRFGVRLRRPYIDVCANVSVWCTFTLTLHGKRKYQVVDMIKMISLWPALFTSDTDKLRSLAITPTLVCRRILLMIELLGLVLITAWLRYEHVTILSTISHFRLLCVVSHVKEEFQCWWRASCDVMMCFVLTCFVLTCFVMTCFVSPF